MFRNEKDRYDELNIFDIASFLNEIICDEINFVFMHEGKEIKITRVEATCAKITLSEN